MWLVSRLASTLAVLVVVSMMLFVLTRATPISPARVVLGPDATPEQIHDFEAGHGLDRSLPAQYAAWAGALASEGFGRSFVTNLSINEELKAAIPVSLGLVSLAFTIAVVGSVLLGGIAALFEDGPADHVVRVVAMVALSVPSFWLGLLLIRFAAVGLGWFPPGGLPEGALARLHALVLPALAIALYYIGALSRLLRASLIEALGQDCTRTGVAMGLTRPRLYAYTLKTALPPFVAAAAMSFGYMFGWAIVIELVFSLPGLSRSLLTAITQRDYPMIQATVLVITVIFIAMNAAADVLQRVVNPKLAGTG